jgi:hypothetical protein
MKVKRILALGLIFALTMATIVGCRATTAVHNTSSPMPFTMTPSNKVKIADAIIAGGLKTGWEIVPVSDGVMTGTLHIRTHVAVVTITYNDKSYNIQYKDSTNLKYKDGKIHPYYNGWIKKLDENIGMELTSLNK